MRNKKKRNDYTEKGRQRNSARLCGPQEGRIGFARCQPQA